MGTNVVQNISEPLSLHNRNNEQIFYSGDSSAQTSLSQVLLLGRRINRPSQIGREFTVHGASSGNKARQKSL